MATRRKTWVGIGLFAIAGSAVPVAGSAALAAGNALTTSHADYTAATTDADARLLLLAQAGGEGGEGGGEAGGEIPESYALFSTDPNAFQYEAGDEVAAYAAGVHASYVAAHEGVVKVAAAIKALLDNPTDETLAAARAAWVEARPAYLVTEAFRFYDGPIEDVEGEINAWPMNEAFIDYVVDKPDAGIINDLSLNISIDEIRKLDQVSDEADVTTGWHAIEFLLWGQDLDANGPGNRPVSDYVAGENNNDRRRAYLEAVTAQLETDLAGLVEAWAPGEDNYAATFTALAPREAVGRILNGMAVLAGSELMSERMAVGLDSGDQEDEHSCFSDTTHQDFVYDVKGIANVWTGEYPNAAGPGMRALVEKVDPALAAEVDGLVADATARVAKLGDPWDQVLAAEPDSPARQDAEAAVTALGELGQGLKRAGEKLGVLVQIPSG